MITREFNQRPSFPLAHSYVLDGDDEFHLFLDGKENSLNLCYQVSGKFSNWENFLDNIAQKTKGLSFLAIKKELQSLKAAELDSYDHFFPLPFALMRNLFRIDEIQTQSKKLVCRCFKVFKEDLNSAYTESNGALTTLLDLTDSTMAGAGCGSCHQDLEKFLVEKDPFSGSKIRIMELSRSQFLLKIDPLVQKWSDQNKAAVKISGIDHKTLLLQNNGKMQNIEIEKSLEAIILKEFSVSLVCSVAAPS